MQNAIDYLMSFPFAEPQRSVRPTETVIKIHDNRVTIGPNWITVEFKNDDEELFNYYSRQSHSTFWNGIADEVIPYFFHAHKVIDLSVFLAHAYKAAPLDGKRAIYHMRQAIDIVNRKTA